MHELPDWVRKINELVENKEKGSKEKLSKQKISLNPSIKITITPKEEGLLWTELLKELSLLNRKGKETIPYSTVFQKICAKFSLKKAKAWNCLLFLAEFGLIDFVRYRGIKLNYEIIVEQY